MYSIVGTCLTVVLPCLASDSARADEDRLVRAEERRKEAVESTLLAEYAIEVYADTKERLEGALIGPEGTSELGFEVEDRGGFWRVSLDTSRVMIRAEFEPSTRAVSLRSLSPSRGPAPVGELDLAEIYRLSAKVEGGELDALPRHAERLQRVSYIVAWADPVDEVLDLETAGAERGDVGKRSDPAGSCLSAIRSEFPFWARMTTTRGTSSRMLVRSVRAPKAPVLGAAGEGATPRRRRGSKSSRRTVLSTTYASATWAN